MAVDLSAYLQDVLEACNSIEYVMSGVSLNEYRSQRTVRSAVKREFIIIGEALRRVRALDEGLFSSITNSRAIVDFRNLVARYILPILHALRDMGGSATAAEATDAVIEREGLPEDLLEQTNNNGRGVRRTKEARLSMPSALWSLHSTTA